MKCRKVLTKVYGESVVSKTRIYEWYKCVQDGREMLMMMNPPDAPAHQQPMKTFKKWNKWLWTIRKSQSEKSLMMLAYWLDHAMKFVRIFWVWNARICGKTIHGFCITNAPAHTSMLVREYCNYAETSIFPRLGSMWLFPISKNKENLERPLF